MNDQKIFYVHDFQDKFLGYVVATSEADARQKAANSMSLDPTSLKIQDTGKTKPKCCPRR